MSDKRREELINNIRWTHNRQLYFMGLFYTSIIGFITIYGILPEPILSTHGLIPYFCDHSIIILFYIGLIFFLWLSIRQNSRYMTDIVSRQIELHREHNWEFKRKGWFLLMKRLIQIKDRDGKPIKDDEIKSAKNVIVGRNNKYLYLYYLIGFIPPILLLLEKTGLKLSPIQSVNSTIIPIIIQNVTIQNYTLQNIFLVSYSILYGIMLNICMGLGLFYFGWIRLHTDNRPLRRFILSVFLINIIPFGFFSYTYNWFSTALGQNPLQILGVFLMSLFVFVPYRFYHVLIAKWRNELYGCEICDTGVEKRLNAIGPYMWSQVGATLFYILITIFGAYLIKGSTAFQDLFTFLIKILDP